METNGKKTLGELIRKARLKKFPNATVKAVARAMGMSQAGLSHIENHGNHPRYSSCVKIAKILDMDERELLILAGHIVVAAEEKPPLITGSLEEKIESPRSKPRNRYGLYEPQDKNEIETIRIANAEIDALITGFALEVKAWRLRHAERGAYDKVAQEMQVTEFENALYLYHHRMQEQFDLEEKN